MTIMIISKTFEGGHSMNVKHKWDALLSRFFILFNLTKPYERPSKKQEKRSKEEKIARLLIEGTILPGKETVMLDDVWGYTKTKVKVIKVHKGCINTNEIIEIYEPYYEGYYRGEKCLMVHEDYKPLRIGESYKLSLTDDQYVKTSEHTLFYQVS